MLNERILEEVSLAIPSPIRKDKYSHGSTYCGRSIRELIYLAGSRQLFRMRYQMPQDDSESMSMHESLINSEISQREKRRSVLEKSQRRQMPISKQKKRKHRKHTKNEDILSEKSDIETKDLQKKSSRAPKSKFHKQIQESSESTYDEYEKSSKERTYDDSYYDNYEREISYEKEISYDKDEFENLEKERDSDIEVNEEDGNTRKRRDVGRAIKNKGKTEDKSPHKKRHHRRKSNFLDSDEDENIEGEIFGDYSIEDEIYGDELNEDENINEELYGSDIKKSRREPYKKHKNHRKDNKRNKNIKKVGDEDGGDEDEIYEKINDDSSHDFSSLMKLASESMNTSGTDNFSDLLSQSNLNTSMDTSGLLSQLVKDMSISENDSSVMEGLLRYLHEEEEERIEFNFLGIPSGGIYADDEGENEDKGHFLADTSRFHKEAKNKYFLTMKRAMRSNNNFEVDDEDDEVINEDCGIPQFELLKKPVFADDDDENNESKMPRSVSKKVSKSRFLQPVNMNNKEREEQKKKHYEMFVKRKQNIHKAEVPKDSEAVIVIEKENNNSKVNNIIKEDDFEFRKRFRRKEFSHRFFNVGNKEIHIKRRFD